MADVTVSKKDADCQTTITFANICEGDNISNAPHHAAMGVFANWAVLTNAHAVKDRLPPQATSVSAAAPIIKSDLQSLMQLGRNNRNNQTECAMDTDTTNNTAANTQEQGTQTIATFSYLPRADQNVPMPFLGMLGLKYLLFVARTQHTTQHKIIRNKNQRNCRKNGKPPLGPQGGVRKARRHAPPCLDLKL